MQMFQKATLFISFSILLLGNAVYSQTLERKVFLGAHLMELSAVEEETGAETGLYLPNILPDATFGNMGIPVGVVLQQINEKEIHSLVDLNPALRGIKAGDALSVVVFENGTQKTYKGTAIGKPVENHPDATIDYDVVNYEGNSLRSLLYLPKGVEQPPVVFFIQGYTCQSIEMRNDNPAKQLLNKFIQNGYAVYLVEKPGMGDSVSITPCMDIDFNQELIAFSEAYKSLNKSKKIDPKNIFIFGHSMGGIIGPLLAEKYKPKGIMVYGIVGKNWYDYMKDIYTEQPLLYGASENQLADNKKYYLPFIKDMLIHKRSNTELVESPIYGKRLKEDGVADNLLQGYFIQRHYQYWQSLSDVDVPGTWAQVKIPVLVLHGEYDIQAIHHKYGEMIVTNVREHGGDATFELFPKTDHAFLQFDSREALNSVMGNGTYTQYFSTNFNSAIAEKSLEWMKQQLNY